MMSSDMQKELIGMSCGVVFDPSKIKGTQDGFSFGERKKDFYCYYLKKTGGCNS